MCHGLGVCRYQIVFFVRQVDVSRLERFENPLDHSYFSIRSSMLDDYL